MIPNGNYGFQLIMMLHVGHSGASPMADKESACNAGDTGNAGLIPGSGRSPGVRSGNLFQYSCLENPMDRGAWWATVHGVTKSPRRLRDSARLHGGLSSSQMFFYYVQKKRLKGYFLQTGHTVSVNIPVSANLS